VGGDYILYLRSKLLHKKWRGPPGCVRHRNRKNKRGVPSREEVSPRKFPKGEPSYAGEMRMAIALRRVKGLHRPGGQGGGTLEQKKGGRKGSEVDLRIKKERL